MNGPLPVRILSRAALVVMLGVAACTKAPSTSAPKNSEAEVASEVRERIVDFEFQEPGISQRVGYFEKLTIPADNPSLAAFLAARLANQEARKAYDREPFSARDGEAILKNNRWVWQARKGLGTGDLIASVSFAADGSARKVGLAVHTGFWE